MKYVWWQESKMRGKKRKIRYIFAIFDNETWGGWGLRVFRGIFNMVRSYDGKNK